MEIDADPGTVWAALTDPDRIERWMVGTRVSTDWREGSPITWRGELNGTAYEDKGEILVVDEPRRLSMTHYSPLLGTEDVPESYHTVTYDLTAEGDRTVVELNQDGNESAEQAQQFSATWQAMLEALEREAETG